VTLTMPMMMGSSILISSPQALNTSGCCDTVSGNPVCAGDDG
jgi:hypothetical protein